jgi:hypothetical protein
MTNNIGPAQQYTPSVVQNSPQQSAVKQQVQTKVAQGSNGQAQKIIKDQVGSVEAAVANVLSQAESSQQPVSRGQVIDIVV